MAAKGGTPTQRIHIPARSARAFGVAKGQLIKVIDVQGKQVADFFAFNDHDRSEVLSPTYTRSALGSLFLREGKALYSNRRRPLLMALEDPVKRHDLLFAACDPARYREYGIEDHASCQVNVLSSLKTVGFTPAEFPHPVNLFQNVEVKGDGSLAIHEPVSKSGDYILLRALEGLLVVVSACPQDQNACNGWNPTDVMVEIHEGD
jgi:uncharacterized protein YcgI (DUF1989 family)